MRDSLIREQKQYDALRGSSSGSSGSNSGSTRSSRSRGGSSGSNRRSVSSNRIGSGGGGGGSEGVTHFESSKTPNKSLFAPPPVSVVDLEKERKLKEEVDQLRKQIEEEKAQLEKLKEKRQEEMKAIKENDLMRKEIEKIKKQQEDLIKAQHIQRDKIITEVVQELRVTKRLKTIRDVFSKWYRKTRPRIERHKQILSIYLWRLKRKAFSQLMKNCESRKSQREQQRVEKVLREQHKREETATKFNRIRTLSRYLIRWITTYKIQKEKRVLQAQHERRRQKMESFLENFSKISEPEEVQQPAPVPNKVRSPSQQQQQQQPVKRSSVRSPSQQPQTTRSPIKEHQPSTPSEIATGEAQRSPLESVSTLESPTTPTIEVIPQEQPTVSQSTNGHLESIETTTEPTETDIVTPATDDDTPNQDETTKLSKSPDIKPPAFLMTMEQRQIERKKRWEVLQQKYKQQELEKEKKRKEEEEKVLAEEAEKKKQLLEEKKREKELAKLKEEEKERKRLEMMEKNRMAYDHYRKSLMKYYGWISLKRLLEKREGVMREAQRYYESGLLYRCFKVLARHRVEMKALRVQEHLRNIELFQRKVQLRIMRNTFLCFVRSHQQIKDWQEQADKLHGEHVRQATFRHWRQTFERVRHQRLLDKHTKEQLAHQFARSFNMRYYFRRWQQFVIEQKEEREKSAIGQELKTKVRSWLEEFRKQNDIEW